MFSQRHIDPLSMAQGIHEPAVIPFFQIRLYIHQVLAFLAFCGGA
jgi:hypothetical protein